MRRVLVALLLILAGGASAQTNRFDEELARIVRNNDSHALDELTRAIEPFGGGHSDKVMAAFLLYGFIARNERARDTGIDALIARLRRPLDDGESRRDSRANVVAGASALYPAPCAECSPHARSAAAL